MKYGINVLVIFGASGTGKSTAAAEIGRRCGISWLQVDDLRLTLQYSNVTLPTGTDALYFFERMPDIWEHSVARLRQGFIDVAAVMAPAVRTVIHNHVITGAPMVLEGDGVLPSLVLDPLLRPLVDDGTIRFCGIRTPPVSELFNNLVARGRGIDVSVPDKHQQQAEANFSFGTWLETEAEHLGIPLVDSRPFVSLPERILTAQASLISASLHSMRESTP